MTNNESALAALDRYHTPGWLLALLDSGDLHEVEYAARNCSDRLNIRLLSERADQLRAEAENA